MYGSQRDWSDCDKGKAREQIVIVAESFNDTSGLETFKMILRNVDLSNIPKKS